MMLFQNENLTSKEFVEVVANTDKSITDKIPEKVLDFFKQKSKKCNKEVVLENGKSLNEQNISEDCKKLLTVIYFSYIANEEEKRELLNKWKNNN